MITKNSLWRFSQTMKTLGFQVETHKFRLQNDVFIKDKEGALIARLAVRGLEGDVTDIYFSFYNHQKYKSAMRIIVNNLKQLVDGEL